MAASADAAVPGGIQYTAEPIWVVHSLSRSASSREVRSNRSQSSRSIAMQRTTGEDEPSSANTCSVYSLSVCGFTVPSTWPNRLRGVCPLGMEP